MWVPQKNTQPMPKNERLPVWGYVGVESAQSSFFKLFNMICCYVLPLTTPFMCFSSLYHFLTIVHFLLWNVCFYPSIKLFYFIIGVLYVKFVYLHYSLIFMFAQNYEVAEFKSVANNISQVILIKAYFDTFPNI